MRVTELLFKIISQNFPAGASGGHPAGFRLLRPTANFYLTFSKLYDMIIKA